MTRPVLWVTRGLPGSGKTTWAHSTGLPVVSRDKVRRWLRPHGDFPHGSPTHEDLVTLAHTAMVTALLEVGHSVVCDDTNLVPEHVQVMAEVAELTGAQLRIHDLTDVPVQVCIARDAARERTLGAEVILRLHALLVAAQAEA
jgi:predicted kinase